MGQLKPVNAIVEEMLGPVITDLPYPAGSEVAVLINGLGATPKEELYLIYRKVASF